MRPHHSSSMHLPPPPQYGIGPRHGSMPFEGSSNGYPGPTSSRNPSGSNSYYYSSSGRPPQPLNAAAFGSNSAAPSPGGHSYRTNPSVDHYPPPHSTATMMGRRTNSLGPSHVEADPSYQVEHLATFAVGRQFGLQSAQDGIRKLKQMEKQSAIWAQPLILKLLKDKISVEDENGDIVEQFPMRLVENPTSQQSQDKMDTYNNILLFVVKGDDRHPPGPPTEMHIFHCIGVSAKDVAQDIHYYTRGQIQKVRGGRRENAAFGGPVDASPYGPIPANYYRDDASPSSNSSEAIDMNVNTLNRCFDDIERFVSRIQSAAIAQREIDMQRMRTRTKPRGKQEGFPPPGILNLRAQMPQYGEFFEIFQKFKLSFNILTLVKEYIHDPNAPELLHFLFTPLIVILDACHWGLGQPVAPQVVSPLLSFDACELLKNCLTSKEFDVWMSLGPNWRTSPEEFRGPLPPPYRPVFRDNFAPYGYPQGEPLSTQTIHRGSSAPPSQRDNLEFERVNLEKERIAFERMKLLERERYLEEQEQRVRQEQARLEAERDLLQKEAVKQRRPSQENYQLAPSPGGKNGHDSIGISPKMRAFLSDLLKHNRKIVEVTYDRVKQHEKELTVIRGEYLDVLSDEKNWWECRNSQNNVGFVPHTILSVITPEDAQALLSGAGNGHINSDQISQRNPPANSAVQTNIHYVVSPNYSQPIPPPPPDSEPRLSSMQKELQMAILKKVEREAANTIPDPIRYKPKQELPYIDDLFDTINGKKVLIPRRQPSNKGVMITHKSTISEIQAWLKEKRFSQRVLILFSNFNGQDLFLMNRDDLEKHCGEEEGKRLYSLILVQKRRANYDSFSKSDPALKAILQMRRIQVEKENEAAAEPEEEPPHNVKHQTSHHQPIQTYHPLDAKVTPLIPPPKVTIPVSPKLVRQKSPPKVVPRKTAPSYQPARLASPPDDGPINRDSWIQTIKSYN